MHERALAAEVVASLAAEPYRVQAVDDLAARCSGSVTEVAAACALLQRGGLLDVTVSGGVRLPIGPQRPTRPVVLIVENTAAVAHLVGALLESEGYQVLIAGTLRLGVDVAAVLPLDVVIVDSFAASAREALPRLRALREAAAAAPVLLFTAHRDLDAAAVEAAGFAGILPKPFDIDELLARVAAVIEPQRRDG